MQLGAEGLPVLAAELEGGLGAIINGIRKIRLAPLRRIAEEIRAGFEQLGGAVIFFAANFQGENAGAGARNGQVSAGLIAEAARGRVLAAFDVIDGHLDALGRHVATEVLGGAQSHDLPARHADVAVVAGDGVAPAAAMLPAGALGDENDLHGFDQLAADLVGLLAIGHAGHLGQHERADAVVIHFLMAPRRDQAVGMLLLQHPVHAARDRIAILSLAGDMAGRKKGHDAQARDGGTALVAFADPRAGALLGALKILQGALDGLVHGFSVLDFCRQRAGHQPETRDQNDQSLQDAKVVHVHSGK